MKILIFGSDFRYFTNTNTRYQYLFLTHVLYNCIKKLPYLFLDIPSSCTIRTRGEGNRSFKFQVLKINFRSKSKSTKGHIFWFFKSSSQIHPTLHTDIYCLRVQSLNLWHESTKLDETFISNSWEKFWNIREAPYNRTITRSHKPNRQQFSAQFHTTCINQIDLVVECGLWLMPNFSGITKSLLNFRAKCAAASAVLYSL